VHLRKSGVIDALKETLHPYVIILFGSYAKAENTQQSDIDLFIIANTKNHFDISRYEKLLGTSLQLFIHTPKEFEKLKKTSPELINNVINGEVLEGFIEVL